MNKSTKTSEEILEEGITNPRPIYIPNAVAGYFADLIIQLASSNIKNIKK
jgi:hypothetical protein